jgi:O-antigen ligase
VRAESEAERGAHLQFLQILGENGVVGLVLYLVFLIALGRAVAYLPPDVRIGALLLLMVWLLRHFDSHDLHSARFAMAPLAYVCGLSWRAQAAQRRSHVQP